MRKKAKRIIVIGLVQGVGFRPFVYRLAREKELNGYVKNTGGNEVEIHVEGEERKIKEFIFNLKTNPPKNSRIEKIIVQPTILRGYNDFRIEKSSEKTIQPSMIPPDIGVCKDCLNEVLNSNTRFYKYAFHSCINCGPRYSIIYHPPYDREKTSMNDFPLCKECEKEYNDPQNLRRFHAQGISCPKCGPQLLLLDKNFAVIEDENPIAMAAQLIEEGNIIAIKGIGGYHIACLATRDDVVALLRKRKKRRTKPFAVMALNLEIVKKHAIISNAEQILLESKEKPIVLLERKPESTVSKLVAPNLNNLGIMLPYTPLHYLLLEETKDKILVMTSGNLSGEPMCTSLECVKNKLKNIVDYTLDHNRKIVNRVDDSLVRLTHGKPVFLRRSRGYAPKWIKVPTKSCYPIIALGGEKNNAGALMIEDKLIMTQYIGDMESYDSVKELFHYLKKLYNWYRKASDKPPIIVMDLHPRYPQNLLWEKFIDFPIQKILKIQHHHAHALQIIAENDTITNNHLVITIDGTGYGEDGNIWGGEVLLVKGKSYKRTGRLEYYPLVGGDQAVKFPGRHLLVILYKLFKEEGVRLFNKYVGSHDRVLGENLKLEQLIEISDKTKVKTSSIGRLLDAISVLLGFAKKSEYEGEPAIILEDKGKKGRLLDFSGIKIKTINDTMVLDTGEIVSQIIEYLESKKNKYDIAYTAQYMVGYGLGKIASKSGITGNTIYVSGGAAVNDIILSGIKDAVSEYGIDIALPLQLPPGDGGLAAGQAFFGSLYSCDDDL